MAFNALFFNEKIQNENYKSNGHLKFLVTLPIVIYSSLVSVFLAKLLTFITSFDPIFKKIKKDKEKYKNKLPTFYKNIKCKIITFFVIVSILTLFFWYFVTAFCAVFPKYQSIWFFDGLQSLCISMIVPFVYALLVTLLRWYALKKKQRKIYCISNLI